MTTTIDGMIFQRFAPVNVQGRGESLIYNMALASYAADFSRYRDLYTHSPETIS